NESRVFPSFSLVTPDPEKWREIQEGIYQHSLEIVDKPLVSDLPEGLSQPRLSLNSVSNVVSKGVSFSVESSDVRAKYAVLTISSLETDSVNYFGLFLKDGIGNFYLVPGYRGLIEGKYKVTATTYLANTELRVLPDSEGEGLIWNKRSPESEAQVIEVNYKNEYMDETLKVYIKDNKLFVGEEEYKIQGVTLSIVGKDKDRKEAALNLKSMGGEAGIRMMVDNGMNTVRTYIPPEEDLLNAFAKYNMKVIVGFPYEEDRWNNAGPDIKGEGYKMYVQRYRNHSAILAWELGNEYNRVLRRHPEWLPLSEWWNVLAEATSEIHDIDPNHPVSTALFDLEMYLPEDAQMAENAGVDIIGLNSYRGDDYASAVNDVRSNINIPMYFSEGGADSYDMREGRENQTMQAEAVVNIWNSIKDEKECLGITFMSWQDEWWKEGNVSIHDTTVNPEVEPSYDYAANEEWWGFVTIDRDPKLVLYEIGELWKSEGEKVYVKDNKLFVGEEEYRIQGVTLSTPRIGGSREEILLDLNSVGENALRMMADNGINTVRTYIPPEKDLLDACARYDIKVIVVFTYIDDRWRRGPDIVSGSYLEYIERNKNHSAILAWELGNELNYEFRVHPESLDLDIWWGVLREATSEVYRVDPNHPVSTALLDMYLTTDILKAEYAGVDLIGLNCYREDDYQEAIRQVRDITHLPMYFSEGGADSYDSREGRENQTMQAEAVVNIWNSIKDGEGCLGITYMSWQDEWWKDRDGTDFTQESTDNHDIKSPYDNVGHEEWWGFVTVDHEPKEALFALKELWTGVVTVVEGNDSEEIVMNETTNVTDIMVNESFIEGNVSEEIVMNETTNVTDI
ncbi:MAG: hypothetical protein KAJ14_16075, partial [Candidatus Omnitrophica bacterium]|nr:hypothetical protein [Candidatus Omnitrophota bacterium]